jgi:hypothetical protein
MSIGVVVYTLTTSRSIRFFYFAMLKNTCALLFLIFCFLMGATAGESSTPPVVLEFFPQKVGHSYTLDVKTIEKSSYAITARFYLEKPKRSFWFSQKQTPEEAARLSHILGGLAKASSGEWVERGVPAQFRVRVFRGTDGKVIVDKLVSRPETNAAYMGRYSILASETLPAGHFKVQIDYLDGAPELASLYAVFMVAKAHHGK